MRKDQSQPSQHIWRKGKTQESQTRSILAGIFQKYKAAGYHQGSVKTIAFKKYERTWTGETNLVQKPWKQVDEK